MRYIVEHMCTNLLHHAFSGILRDWYDFAATISGRESTNTRVHGVQQPGALLGAMEHAVRNAVEEFGSDGSARVMRWSAIPTEWQPRPATSASSARSSTTARS
ncbi:hydantoinase B/oxoprolinase family protein [Pseudonocardia sp. MCCB 268]|nr:hydantoinase B/oxoprolinase family protein [Pseudonocardia cytotoxica]